jgi:hypothetical protein
LHEELLGTYILILAMQVGIGEITPPETSVSSVSNNDSNSSKRSHEATRFLDIERQLQEQEAVSAAFTVGWLLVDTNIWFT